MHVSISIPEFFGYFDKCPLCGASPARPSSVAAVTTLIVSHNRVNPTRWCHHKLMSYPNIHMYTLIYMYTNIYYSDLQTDVSDIVLNPLMVMMFPSSYTTSVCCDVRSRFINSVLKRASNCVICCWLHIGVADHIFDGSCNKKVETFFVFILFCNFVFFPFGFILFVFFLCFSVFGFLSFCLFVFLSFCLFVFLSFCLKSLQSHSFFQISYPGFWRFLTVILSYIVT